jgi:hypothetical protein
MRTCAAYPTPCTSGWRDTLGRRKELKRSRGSESRAAPGCLAPRCAPRSNSRSTRRGTAAPPCSRRGSRTLKVRTASTAGKQLAVPGLDQDSRYQRQAQTGRRQLRQQYSVLLCKRAEKGQREGEGKAPWLAVPMTIHRCLWSSKTRTSAFECRSPSSRYMLLLQDTCDWRTIVLSATASPFVAACASAIWPQQPGSW